MPYDERGRKSIHVGDADMILLQIEVIRRPRNDAVERIADAEHQRDAEERRCPDFCQIQDEEHAVIDRVRHDRFKEHIVRFAPPVEGRVEDVLHGVEDVETEENHTNHNQRRPTTSIPTAP